MALTGYSAAVTDINSELVSAGINQALKKGGVFYASFKYGDPERDKNGRFFSDFTEASLRALLDETGGLQITDLWTADDVRPDRAGERWINVLCTAGPD